jgi:hypothetical protein
MNGWWIECGASGLWGRTLPADLTSRPGVESDGEAPQGVCGHRRATGSVPRRARSRGADPPIGRSEVTSPPLPTCDGRLPHASLRLPTGCVPARTQGWNTCQRAPVGLRLALRWREPLPARANRDPRSDAHRGRCSGHDTSSLGHRGPRTPPDTMLNAGDPVPRRFMVVSAASSTPGTTAGPSPLPPVAHAPGSGRRRLASNTARSNGRPR